MCGCYLAAEGGLPLLLRAGGIYCMLIQDTLAAAEPLCCKGYPLLFELGFDFGKLAFLHDFVTATSEVIPFHTAWFSFSCLSKNLAGH